jgi:hypothetical protein
MVKHLSTASQFISALLGRSPPVAVFIAAEGETRCHLRRDDRAPLLAAKETKDTMIL